MIRVCALYMGAITLLAEFEKREEAEEFMKHDCILDDDYVVETNEMFIESDVGYPF